MVSRPDVLTCEVRRATCHVLRATCYMLRRRIEPSPVLIRRFLPPSPSRPRMRYLPISVGMAGTSGRPTEGTEAVSAADIEVRKNATSFLHRRRIQSVTKSALNLSFQDPRHGPRAEAMAKLRLEMKVLERQRVIEALEQSAGNQTRAAKLLGISLRTLINRIDEYGIPRPRKRTP